MAQQMNPVDPATALILQAMNQINPVTESGQPTVAADVLSKLSQMGATQMSPSVGQAAEQAGIASQLDAMKMQKAQQALMNQAMAQSPEATGIAPMAGEVRMADGGIVGDVPGYAGGAYVKNPFALLFEKIQEMGLPTRGGATSEKAPPQEDRVDPEIAREILAASAPMQEIPEIQIQEAPAPAPERKASAQAADRAPGLSKSSAPVFGELFDEVEKYKAMSRTPTQQQVLDTAMADRAAREQFARMTGNDPELMTKMAGEYERLYTDQLAKIEARRAAAQERADKGGIGAWLRGFRQMKGQGIGEGFRTATEAGEAFDETMRGRIERLEDLGLEIQRTRMEKVNALRQQKYLTDMGDFTGAQKKGQDAVDAARREQLLTIDLKKFQAGEASQEARTAATIRSQDAARAESAALRSEQEKQRVLLAAQGRLTEAEKLRSNVADKVKTVLALPKDAKDPMTRQMRENAEREMRQANQNVDAARALYTNLLNQNIVAQGGASPMTGAEGQFKLVGVQPSPR